MVSYCYCVHIYTAVSVALFHVLSYSNEIVFGIVTYTQDTQLKPMCII